jgi:uncharacterized protein YkwD
VNRGTPAPAASSRRAAIAVSGALVLAVLIGGSLYLARGVLSPGPSSAGRVPSSPTTAGGCGAAGTSPCASGPAAMAVAAGPAVVTVPPSHVAVSTHRMKAAPSVPVSASLSAPVTAAPSAGGTSAQPSASDVASPSASPMTSSMASPTGSATANQGGAPAAQVLALINRARAAAGLPALTVIAGLESTSSAHNLLMAHGCGLSHQCPGEPPIGDRETAAGVAWTAAGENIGEGGPVADTSSAIAAMAVGLTQSMLNEQPPNDGHRLNILSAAFTHIGIAVYRDSSGTVWLTQDFAN